LFKFWAVDVGNGLRVPYRLHLDPQFNALELEVDPERQIQNMQTAKRNPRNEITWGVDDAGRRVPTHIPQDLVEAHRKVVGGQVLSDPAEESIRQAYLRDLEAMVAASGDEECSGCQFGALTRKYQDLMMAAHEPAG